jgi:hypothetical protein
MAEFALQNSFMFFAFIFRAYVFPVSGCFNPLNRSQKLRAMSKMPMGVSNHHRLTILSKSGKM